MTANPTSPAPDRTPEPDQPDRGQPERGQPERGQPECDPPEHDQPEPSSRAGLTRPGHRDAVPRRRANGLFAGLRDRWRHHVGDRPLAAAIHREVVALGYARSAARIRDLRLAVVERPGYRQVYRFEVSACSRDDGSDAELFGVSREDPRSTRIDVYVATNEAERDRTFATWSEDMITLEAMRGRRRSRLEIALLAAFGIALALAIVSAIVRSP